MAFPSLHVCLDATVEAGSQISAIYLETIRDVAASIRQPLPEFPPGAPPQPPIFQLSDAELRARVTVHEVGHQFALAADVPDADPLHRNDLRNIMNINQVNVPAGAYFFNPIDIAALRSRIKSPGEP